MSSNGWIRGAGGGCFTGGTLVSTPIGETPIKDLQIGDLVVSFDDTGTIHEAKVLKVHTHQNNKVNRYHFWGQKHIDATPNHWVLNQFNTFVAIGSLGSDDCLIDENDHLRPILKVEELGLDEVFNLTVENQHTFIANGIRVHNAGLGAGAIQGAGGGGKGGGGGTPKEDDDTLFSESKARVIDLLSEGEIIGLLSAEKSIYLNETPLKDSAGNSNFDDVSYATREGTNSQSYIPGFAGTEQGVNVGIIVTKDAPGAIIRTFSSTTVDAVRVTINTPSLLDADNDKGDLHGSSVSFKIYLEKDNNGSWYLAKTDSFTGKTSAKYERQYRLDIPTAWKSSGFTTIAIKVERTSDDATSTKVQNEMYFASYTKVIDNKLRYPNSAIIATQVDARQFTSIPTRAYEIKGVKIKVPSNYTPYDPGHCSLSGYRRQDRCTQAGGTWTGTSPGDTLYTGSWDGTFDTEWSCNPAWILYDLCTDDRYGLGKWLSANQMDKWSLYEIGKYCDAVDNSGKFTGVDDGWGNKEARFACNLYLQGREEAFKVLNDIASAFRGMIYWQQGQISSVQDAPKDPVMNFSDANVINGTFTYEGTSRKQRHNVAHVQWNNPEDFYRQNVEYVEDAPGIVNANNQIFATSVVAVGCTSQGQARRVGKWILYTERYETETVTFSTGMEGAVVRPGDIIKVADSSKAGVRYGGRIAAGSTTTNIKLDAATSVTSGKTYKLSLINTEEACIQSGVKQAETTQETCLNANVDNEWKPYVWVETKDVTTVSTTESVSEITVTSAFENTPTTNYMWILEEIGSVEAADFRVLLTRESGPNIVEISALKYHEAKYGYIEEDIAFSSKSTSSLPNPSDPIPSPTNLSISEELYIDSMGNVKNRAEFSWDAPKTAGTATTYPYIASYYVEWRRKKPAITNWTSMGETSAQSVIIDDAPAGTLEFRVKTRRIF
jgi:predicted phage tail protein